MTERLQKIIAARGIASRRQAEELIIAGRVCCNGKVSVLGQSADPEIDTITVDGKPLPPQGQYIYLMLHKPRGYVTTLSDERGRKNAAQLVADCGVRVYPVGRLDMDSEGLLLFTNDGAFANMMMHPKHEVDKVYHTWVTGYSPENCEKLKRPVALDGYTVRAPQVQVLQSDGQRALLSVTIHEGRYRQVRKMCAMAGMQVNRLKRISEGSLMLGDLPLGKWRHLTPDELNKLQTGGR